MSSVGGSPSGTAMVGAPSSASSTVGRPSTGGTASPSARAGTSLTSRISA